MPSNHFLTGLILLLCLVLSIPAQASQPFPDTGQTKCYDNTREIPCPEPGQPFYGQDAEYPRLPQSYTKLGMNGVELPDDAAHVGAGGPWIMTRDNVTGLIWEVKTNANRNDTYTWANAQSQFITGLNNSNFGGFSNWRLPTRQELASLVNADVFNPAIDRAWFPNTVSSGYWSSSAGANDTDGAWRVDFNNGYVGHGNRTGSYYVRAVRSGQ